MIVTALLFNERGSRFYAHVDASQVSAIEEGERPMLSGETIPVCVVTLRGSASQLFLVDRLGTADDRSISLEIRLGMGDAGDERTEALRRALVSITTHGGDTEA